ncbi:MAG: hypothetical protein NZ893_01525 [Candidatus Aenigmarchaeota archaeon]|nr:hypothetical protein [Candidatus Aenigmarchaeota archaeon]
MSQSNHHHHHIEFAVLDPFNVSFYDRKSDKIFIDEKFKKSEKLDKIIKHEISHQKNPFSFETLNFSLLPEIVKFKPLHLLQILFPFVLAKTKDNKIMFGVDPLGIIGLIVLIVTLSVLITYRAEFCYSRGFVLECYRCTVWGCENISSNVTKLFINISFN